MITFSVSYTISNTEALGGEEIKTFALTVTVVEGSGLAVVGGGLVGGGGAGANANESSITVTTNDQTAEIYADTASSFTLYGPTFSS